MESETLCSSCSRTSSLIRMHAPVYAGMGSRVGCLPNCSKRFASMSGSEHYLRLPMPGLPTQLNDAQSPPPALRIFGTKRTELVASPSGCWTGSNRACVTIGSRAACRPPELASTSSFGSHTGALTRYTLPPRTVGSSGSTRQSLFTPVRFQKHHLARTVTNCQRSFRSV